MEAEIAENIAKRWRYSNNTVRLIVTLIRHHMMPHTMFASDKSLKNVAARIVTRIGKLAVALLTLAKADSSPELQHLYTEAIEEAKRMLSRPRPVVDGRMIMEKLGIKPGPLVGKLKQRAYEIQLQYGINDPDKIIEILRNELLDNNE